MMKYNITIAIALVLALPCTAQLQMADKTKLDSFFSALELNNKFMGTIAVAKSGTLLYTRSLGYSNIATATKATPASRYRIGSVTKMFTAVLVLKAVEEKKLGLHEKLAAYYPGIENADSITIEQLLYHRSGISNFTDDSSYQQWSRVPQSEDELLHRITMGGSNFEPGCRFEYSNSNYVLLSFILQKIYKTSYTKLLESGITKPVKMNSTYYGGKITPQKQECFSYAFGGSWQQQPETDMSIPAGAGAIVSTTADLVKFGEALFGGKLLKSTTLEQMIAVKDRFGMGIFPIPFFERKGFGHTGAIDGFTSTLYYFPEDKLSFVLLSNATNYSNNDIAIKVLSAYYGKPFDIPHFTVYEVAPGELDAYLGNYASKQLPLKLAITKDQNTLIVQATGQQPLPLEAVEKNKFTFDKAGIVLKFNPEDHTVILLQGGMEFLFTKE